MKKQLLVLVLLLLSLQAGAQAHLNDAVGQGFCNIPNFSFKSGEKLTYKVFYNLSFMYVGAGEVTFTINQDELKGHSVYHVVGLGHTYSSYDWFFKVRDRYETFIDTATMLPVRFIRDVSEGDYKKYNVINFDQDAKKATSLNGTYDVPACIQDVLSSIYYARNIDFDKYKPGEKIPYSLFLDDEVYHIYIRYLGKTTINTRYGKFNSIVFKPLLIQGTLFKGGEKMTVWVSDDKNRIPLRVNSPITVGSIKVDMIDYKNLRHPL